MIPLRAHMLDLTTFHLLASDEVTQDMDEALTAKAMEILGRIFSAVSDADRYDDAQVDVAIKIETSLAKTQGSARATLTVYKAFTSKEIVVVSESGEFAGSDYDRHSLIRNNAATEACEKVCWALAGNKELKDYVRALSVFEATTQE